MNDYEFWESYLEKLKIEILKLCRKKAQLHIDLHIHSNYSADGKQSLKQILDSTKKAGFDIISITDHDTLNVYDELYNYLKNNKVTMPLIIPGVELTVDNREYGNQCHLLQLFINPKDKGIQKSIEINFKAMFNRSKIQFQRLKENLAMQELLKKNNIKISYSEYVDYLSKNEMIPEYDTLCFFLIDKLKSKYITTFNVLDKLEKYNLDDCYEDRKQFKANRYKKLREKYKEIETNFYNYRFLLSMLAVREVDDDWWDKPSSGSLSVNSYGQLKVEDLSKKYKIFFAHPSEKSLDVVKRILRKNNNIIGLEMNVRNEYLNINKFHRLLDNKKLFKVIGSDSHDNTMQFYKDMSFYLITASELEKIIYKI